MGSRPAPVRAQTEKELYLVEEQRTEHRTLPGLQGAPEDRMFTTQAVSYTHLGVLHHALQHLGGGDDGLARIVAAPDDVFLNDGNFGKINLYAHVAAKQYPCLGILNPYHDIIYNKSNNHNLNNIGPCYTRNI